MEYPSCNVPSGPRPHSRPIRATDCSNAVDSRTEYIPLTGPEAQPQLHSASSTEDMQDFRGQRTNFSRGSAQLLEDGTTDPMLAGGSRRPKRLIGEVLGSLPNGCIFQMPPPLTNQMQPLEIWNGQREE